MTECYRCEKDEFDAWLGAYTFQSPNANDHEERTLCATCYHDFWEWMDDD